MPKVTKIKAFYRSVVLTPSSFDCFNFVTFIFSGLGFQSYILKDGAQRRHNFRHFKF